MILFSKNASDKIIDKDIPLESLGIDLVDTFLEELASLLFPEE